MTDKISLIKNINKIRKGDNNMCAAEIAEDHGLESRSLTDIEITTRNRQVPGYFQYKTLVQQIINSSLPITIDNLIFVSNGVLSNFITKNIGSDVVAADAYIGTFKNLFFYPFCACFYALGPIQSRSEVLHDYAQVGQQFWHGMIFGAVISIPIMSLFALSKIILIALGQPSVLASLTFDYFKFQLWGVAPALANESIFQFLIATQNEKYLIPFSIVRTGLELSMVALFTRLFNFGMPGWGLASAIQPWMSLSIALIYLSKNKKFEQYGLFSFSITEDVKIALRNAWSTIKKITSLGLPIFADIFMEIGSRFFNTLLIGRKSQQALAAYGIAYNYFSWIAAPLTALSITSGIFVSKAHHSSDNTNPSKIVKAALFIGVTLCLILLPLFLLLPKLMIQVFLPNHAADNDAIINYGSQFLPLLGINTSLFALKYIGAGGLRGFEETKSPMLATLLGMVCLGLSLSFLFYNILDWNLRGIGCAEILGVLITSITILTRFRSVAATLQEPFIPLTESTSEQASIANIMGKVGVFESRPNYKAIIKNESESTTPTNRLTN